MNPPLQNQITKASCIGFFGFLSILAHATQAQYISIPVPQGLVEASKLSPIVKARSEAALTPGASLLGSFLTPDALSSVLKTEYYEPDSSAVATLLQQFKSESECTERWNILRANMIKEIDGGTKESTTERRIYNRFEENLRKISEEDADRIEGNSSLGIALDNENVIAASSVLAINFDPKTNTRKEYSAVTVGIQRVGNSLVSILVTEKFDGAESIKNSVSKFAEWSNRILYANMASKK